MPLLIMLMNNGRQYLYCLKPGKTTTMISAEAPSPIGLQKWLLNKIHLNLSALSMY